MPLKKRDFKENEIPICARLDMVTTAARTISVLTVCCSTIEIGSAYHHSNDTVRLNNAVADYRLDSDVKIRLV